MNMKKIRKIAGAVVVLLVAIACSVIWMMFRHPYEAKYFTPEMQTKYPTVESVLDAWRLGWKCDIPEHSELVNEVYGFNVAGRYGKRAGPRQDEMDAIKSISYSKDNRLAFVITERSGWAFVMRKNRWVFYPETPWFGFVEMAHSR